MDFAVPPDDGPLDPMWWAPLEQVARTVTGTRRHRFFDIDDFMLMVRLVRRDRPDLTVYKHRFTRRSLHLADDASPYRFVAPRRLDLPGRHIRARSLDQALDHLGLWELPWMKDELAPFRQGLSWDDRWTLHPDADHADANAGVDDGGTGRGGRHLRLV